MNMSCQIILKRPTDRLEMSQAFFIGSKGSQPRKKQSDKNIKLDDIWKSFKVTRGEVSRRLMLSRSE